MVQGRKGRTMVYVALRDDFKWCLCVHARPHQTRAKQAGRSIRATAEMTFQLDDASAQEDASEA